MHNFTMPQPCLEVSVVASRVAEYRSSECPKANRADPRACAASSIFDELQR